MKAPGDTRPTWRNGIIQIHITRACDLACTACTQGSNLGGKPTMITLENFQLACESLKDYYGVIGIFGGNPVMHPQFEEICHIFSSIIPFEQRGLWSNNLRGYGKLCKETFNPAVSNLNVHTSLSAYNEMKQDWPECNPIGLEHDSRHSPPFVALNDIKDLSYAYKWSLIQNCDINKYWSAMVCQVRGQLRGFFCELAGAQSMLHENEPEYPDTGIPIIKGWWKLPIEYFHHQIQKHCFECGVPLRAKGDLAVNGTKEFVSETHLPIYKLKKKKELVVVNSLEQLGGKVERATDYIQNGLEDYRVLIGVPTQEFARRADFYDHLEALHKPAGTGKTVAHGQSPARNRNLIIQQALQHNFTHILFLDDDVIFQPDLLTKLLAHDKDIVTGLYLMRNFPHLPIIFDRADSSGRCLHHFLNDGEKGLVEIVACGLGACLIKTDVFRAMLPSCQPRTENAPPNWIRLGELEPDHWCDDISFFRRVREHGYKLYCDLDTPVGHIASVVIWPNIQDGKWYSTYDTSGSGTASVPQFSPQLETV